MSKSIFSDTAINFIGISITQYILLPLAGENAAKIPLFGHNFKFSGAPVPTLFADKNEIRHTRGGPVPYFNVIGIGLYGDTLPRIATQILPNLKFSGSPTNTYHYYQSGS